MFDFTQAQQQAITALDCNVSVSAGAGSGKTRVLVERFVNILKQGLTGEKSEITSADILAITFTRKAAGEMKERVRRRLAELEQKDTVNAVFWRRQLEALEQARINTIHGFCNSLLKENPVEAGLDPAFQVAEEVEMDEFLQRTVRQFIRNGLRHGDESILRLSDEYTATALVQHILMVWPKLENILAYGDLAIPYEQANAAVDELQNNLIILMKELVAGRAMIKSPAHRKKLELLSEELTALCTAAMQSSLPGNMALLDSYVGTLKATSSDKVTVKAAKEILQRLHLAMADTAALALLPCWQQVLTNCALYVREQQDLNNMLGFDDLESRALALLKNNQQVCAKNNARYRYVMVDEFQDTNERQRQLVYMLCGGVEDELHGQKLFVVGDAKQSIYRFRGADVSVFARVRRDIAAVGGRNIVLDDNFRTVDKILDLCNRVFAVLLGEDQQQDVYFEALNANRSTELLPEMFLIAYDNDSKSKRREAEATVVAQRMEELHRKEGIAYADMVILLSALTNSKIFASALRQEGIPCVIVDGKGFYERQEIIDLFNLLVFLEDSSRNLELAGVLRSPYFAVDDECLTALFLAKRENASQPTLWQQLNQGLPSSLTDESQKKLREAIILLKQLRQAATIMPLPELLREIVSCLQLQPLLAAQEFGMERLANVKKMIALAEAFATEKHGTLADYLLRLQQLRQASAREAAAADQTDNVAVTIMTIHKSKGLEFPVVFLPALDAKNRSDTDMLRFSDNIGLGIKVEMEGELRETSVMTQIKEVEKKLTNDEKQRQLYVAMTRAKDRLILSGTYDSNSKSKSENWFNNLRKILREHEQMVLREYNAAGIEAGTGPIVIEPELQVGEELLQSIKPLPEYGLGWQSMLSPTALQTYLICPRRYYYKYVMRMPLYDTLEEANVIAGVSLPANIQGILLHRALELFTNGYSRQQAWLIALQESNITGDTCYVQELYLNYLKSELFQKLEGRERKAEQSFRLQLLADFGIKAFFYGYIDCTVFNSEGTLTIIDYKTGQPPQQDEPQQGYIFQLALYKKAAELLWGKPVRQAELHFLRNNFCWQLTENDAGALQAAADLCREIFAKTKECEFAVQTSYCASCAFDYFCPHRKQ